MSLLAGIFAWERNGIPSARSRNSFLLSLGRPVAVALALFIAIPACIFVGLVNAVGSGLIRDVLVREEPLMLKPGQFYVVASLLGVCSFALLTLFFKMPLVPAAFAGILIRFLFRLLAIIFDWKTRSVRRPSPGD